MVINDKIEFTDLIGHQTFLYGEIDTKKTYYTAKFVDFLLKINLVNPQEISILDFAPKLRYINNLKVGGQIQDYSSESLKCNYIQFEGEIIPPRLSSKNKKELFNNLCHNFKITSGLLKKFREAPTKVLIINDISIYLHLGNKANLLDIIRRAKTFFGNSYYGKSIKSKFFSLLSILEKKRVEYLIKNIENSVLMK
ncbi:MAG: hypothetical protein ACFE8M_14035 [Candidatus Hermodarchaeota archaeon]